MVWAWSHREGGSVDWRDGAGDGAVHKSVGKEWSRRGNGVGELGAMQGARRLQGTVCKRMQCDGMGG